MLLTADQIQKSISSIYRSVLSLNSIGKSLWPKGYDEFTEECALNFIRACRTWNEAEMETQPFPDRAYIRHLTRRWVRQRKRGKPIYIEKCRRMVVSWLVRALELWAMGLNQCNWMIGGENFASAAKHVWRLERLYENLPRTWLLPESHSISHQGENMLRQFSLPNGSIATAVNGDADKIQGEGVSGITLEEMGTYRALKSILGQAAIIVQGSAKSVSGFIVGITNACARTDWQGIKKYFKELRRNVVIMPGLTEVEADDGSLYIKLEYFADPDKDAAWLAKIKEEMRHTPREFRREILMDDTIHEGDPVFPEYNPAIHEYHGDPKIAAAADGLLVGGWDCVAGDTLIYDPETMTETRVDVLAKAGHPITVLSMDGPVRALCPYVAGRKQIFTVTTESGESVRVTSGHKFLTTDGWLALSELAIGDQIALLPMLRVQRASNAIQTVQGYQCDCSPCCRPYDEQLLLVGGTDRYAAPLRADVRELVFGGHGKDDRASEERYIRSCQPSCRPSNGGSYRHELSLEGEECRGEPLSQGCSLHLAPFLDQSPSPNECRLQALEPSNHTSQSCVCQYWTYREATRFVGLRSIVPGEIEDYYDLIVPGPNNYLAHGIWHHNCGTSRMPAFVLALRTASSKQVRWVMEVIPDKPMAMETFAPMVRTALKKFLPGRWGQVRHIGDPTVRTRGGAREASSAEVARDYGFDITPGIQKVDTREKAVIRLLTDFCDDEQKKPRVIYCTQGCPVLVEGMRGAYHTKPRASGDPSGPGQEVMEPSKNFFSHANDSHQYPSVFFEKELISGQRKRQFNRM